MSGKLNQLLSCFGVNTNIDGNRILFDSLNLSLLGEDDGKHGVDILTYLYENYYDNIDIASEIIGTHWLNLDFEEKVVRDIYSFISDQIIVTEKGNFESGIRGSIFKVLSDRKILMFMPEIDGDFINIRCRDYKKKLPKEFTIYNSKMDLRATSPLSLTGRRSLGSVDVDIAILNLAISIYYIKYKETTLTNINSVVDMWAYLVKTTDMKGGV